MSRCALLASVFVLASASAASAAYSVETYAQANYGEGNPVYLRQDNLSSYAIAEQTGHSKGWSSVTGGRLKAYTWASMPADSAFASASAWVRLQDSLTITGPESGALTQLRLTYTVHGTLYSDRVATSTRDDAWGSATATFRDTLGLFDNGFNAASTEFDFRTTTPSIQSFTTVLTAHVGDTVSIDLYLNSQVFSGVNGNWGMPAALACSDFGNTSTLSVEPLDPDVNYVSDSGFTYSVPEPSLGGVLIGVFGLIVRRQRHN